LCSTPDWLEQPGIKDIEQVELFCKYRNYVTVADRDTLCPEPDAIVFQRLKSTKNEKIRKLIERNLKRDAEEAALETRNATMTNTTTANEATATKSDDKVEGEEEEAVKIAV
jgi:hypothetical protein